MIMFGAGSDAGEISLLLLILAEGQAFALGPILRQLKQCTTGDKIKKIYCMLQGE